MYVDTRKSIRVWTKNKEDDISYKNLVNNKYLAVSLWELDASERPRLGCQLEGM